MDESKDKETFYDCESDQRAMDGDVPRLVETEDAWSPALEQTEGVSDLSQTHEPLSPSDEFAIDEVHLKELESLMTDEQKQQYHQESMELKREGNDAFVKQLWSDAAKYYTKALLVCPPSFGETRAIFYSNRAACFIKKDQNEQAIEDCSKAIELDPNYAKAYFRRAQLYENKEETWDKALDDYQKTFQLQPDNSVARAALMRLPPMIEERNKRMKDEMINKLKDLGNLFLRPFGLSTDNFKLEQNAEGGYSVQMKK